MFTDSEIAKTVDHVIRCRMDDGFLHYIGCREEAIAAGRGSQTAMQLFERIAEVILYHEYWPERTPYLPKKGEDGARRHFGVAGVDGARWLPRCMVRAALTCTLWRQGEWNEDALRFVFWPRLYLAAASILEAQ